MVTDQLLDYVRQELKAGFSKEEIAKRATSGGWSAQDMTEAFATLEKATAPVTPAPAAIPVVQPAPATGGIPSLQKTPQQHHLLRTFVVILVLIIVLLAAGVAAAAYLGMLPALLSYVPGYGSSLPTTPAQIPPTSVATTAPTSTDQNGLQQAAAPAATTTSATAPSFETTATSTAPITPSASPAQTSRDQQRVSDLQSIQAALAQYLSTQSSYPASLSAIVPTYIAALPTDPLDGTSYYYTQVGSSYTLSADLETDDSSLKTGSAVLLQGGCMGASNRYCYIVSPN